MNLHVDISQVPSSARKTIPLSICEQLSLSAANSWQSIWLSVWQLLLALGSLNASLSILIETL